MSGYVDQQRHWVYEANSLEIVNFYQVRRERAVKYNWFMYYGEVCATSPER